jgi:hypothetical protein
VKVPDICVIALIVVST